MNHWLVWSPKHQRPSGVVIHLIPSSNSSCPSPRSRSERITSPFPRARNCSLIHMDRGTCAISCLFLCHELEDASAATVPNAGWNRQIEPPMNILLSHHGFHDGPEVCLGPDDSPSNSVSKPLDCCRRRDRSYDSGSSPASRPSERAARKLSPESDEPLVHKNDSLAARIDDNSCPPLTTRPAERLQPGPREPGRLQSDSVGAACQPVLSTA